MDLNEEDKKLIEKLCLNDKNLIVYDISSQISIVEA